LDAKLEQLIKESFAKAVGRRYGTSKKRIQPQVKYQKAHLFNMVSWDRITYQMIKVHEKVVSKNTN